jgi:hypothetical protein
MTVSFSTTEISKLRWRAAGLQDRQARFELGPQRVIHCRSVQNPHAAGGTQNKEDALVTVQSSSDREDRGIDFPARFLRTSPLAAASTTGLKQLGIPLLPFPFVPNDSTKFFEGTQVMAELTVVGQVRSTESMPL